MDVGAVGFDEGFEEVVERELALLDFDLGPQKGTEFIKRAQSAGFRGKVLVVTAGISELVCSSWTRREG